jgi:hypothetical protein
MYNRPGFWPPTATQPPTRLTNDLAQLHQAANLASQSAAFSGYMAHTAQQAPARFSAQQALQMALATQFDIDAANREAAAVRRRPSMMSDFVQHSPAPTRNISVGQLLQCDYKQQNPFV